MHTTHRPQIHLLLSLLAVLALVPFAGFADETADNANEPPAVALQEVEAVKVCMVNDQLFARDQIPVEVDGRTYFGCCEMCKARLATDEAIRSAVDPLTGEKVDKATAIKAADAEGAISYFANRENFERFLAQLEDEATNP